MKTSTQAPGAELLRAVRAGFALQGTTLGRWCRDRDIKLQHARCALLGSWDGPKGREVRAQIVSAARADRIALEAA